MPDEVNGDLHPDAEYPDEGMAEPHDRLRQARLAAGFASARAAARAYGWNAETYKAHESGARGLKKAVAARYASAYRIELAWLLLGLGEGPRGGAAGVRGERPKAELPLAPVAAFAPIMGNARDQHARELPVYGTLVETGEGELVDYSSESGRLPPPRSLAGVNKGFGVYVVGDSCAPRFNPGDLVWVNPGKPPIRGCGVVVVFKNKTAMVKIYGRRDEKVIEVEQINPAQKVKIPRAEVEGVYRIVTTDHA